MGFLNLDARRARPGVPRRTTCRRAAGRRSSATRGRRSRRCCATTARIGFNLVVSSGQELVTTTADYLDYALDQPTTRVVALLLETVRDARRFRAALARAAERRRPGGGAEGRRGPAAAGAGGRALRRAGRRGRRPTRRSSTRTACCGCDDLDELADTLELLAAGRRAGPGAASRPCTTPAPSARWSVDVAARARRAVRAAGRRTRWRGSTTLLDPGWSRRTRSTCGAPARTPAALFARALRGAGRRPGVAVVALARRPGRTEYDGETAYLDAALDAAAATDKPVVVLSNLHQRARPGAGAAAARRPASRCSRAPGAGCSRCGTCSSCATAVAAAGARRRGRRGARGPVAGRLAAGSPSSARRARSCWPTTASAVAAHRRRDPAARRSRRPRTLGYPVVLKTDEPAVAHKSDVGGVVLGLADAERVRARTRTWPRGSARGSPCRRRHRPASRSRSGWSDDPQLGPLVLVAAGGVLVELLQRPRARRPTAGPCAVRSALVDRLRVRPLLDGVRGAAAGRRRLARRRGARECRRWPSSSATRCRRST